MPNPDGTPQRLVLTWHGRLPLREYTGPFWSEPMDAPGWWMSAVGGPDSFGYSPPTAGTHESKPSETAAGG